MTECVCDSQDVVTACSACSGLQSSSVTKCDIPDTLMSLLGAIHMHSSSHN